MTAISALESRQIDATGMTSRYALVPLALAAFIAGCGGGGSNPPVAPDPEPPPPAAAPAVAFSVDRAEVAPGQSVALEWTSTDATSCEASGGWTGARAVSGGERSGALDTATEFALECSGEGGTASASVLVSVDAAANRQPTLEAFRSSDANVALGEVVTFSWTAADQDEDALSCVLDLTGAGPEIAI
ncbi:MAG: hypothetical protein AAF184_25110, partial [Pseudomonadota bacterium]